MHNCVKSLEVFVLYVHKTLASLSQNQLTKQFQGIAKSKLRFLNCLMGKFAGLDRLLFWFSVKFEKLATANSTTEVNRDSVVYLEAISSQAVLVF